jgi:hypothetical protein
VETTNMPSSARRRAIAVWRSNTGRWQGVVVVKAVDEDDLWWERWCRGAVPGVSWRSSSGRVCVKESWACKLARRGSVTFVSRCVQVLVSVTVRCSWSVVVYVSRREDQVQVWGGGKPVKGSLFNETLSLHEAGVDGVVHEVVGIYCARGGRCVPRLLAWLGSPDHAWFVP